MAVPGSPDVNASMTACTGEVSSIRKLNGVVAVPGGPDGRVAAGEGRVQSTWCGPPGSADGPNGDG